MTHYIAIIEQRSRVIAVEDTESSEFAMDAVVNAYDRGDIIPTEADIDTGPHFEDETDRWIEDPDSTEYFTRISATTYEEE